MPKPFTKNDPRINRKGRPKKGQSLTDILDWALDQKRKIKETGEEKLLRQMLAQRLINKAVDDGDVSAIKYIYDRIDGKPKEIIEMTEKRDDIPSDPEERRAMAERIERELGLTRMAPPPVEEKP
jgi:ABC-type ATPase with predicted acetyltransferase domain